MSVERYLVDSVDVMLSYVMALGTYREFPPDRLEYPSICTLPGRRAGTPYVPFVVEVRDPG